MPPIVGSIPHDLPNIFEIHDLAICVGFVPRDAILRPPLRSPRRWWMSHLSHPRSISRSDEIDSTVSLSSHLSIFKKKHFDSIETQIAEKSVKIEVNASDFI